MSSRRRHILPRIPLLFTWSKSRRLSEMLVSSFRYFDSGRIFLADSANLTLNSSSTMKRECVLSLGRRTITTWAVLSIFMGSTAIQAAFLAQARPAALMLFGKFNAVVTDTVSRTDGSNPYIRTYFQWFSNYSYTQPSFVPEFQGGKFSPWGGEQKSS